nr:MAG TPA: hypothetical protein [Bacteriophage sp.]
MIFVKLKYLLLMKTVRLIEPMNREIFCMNYTMIQTMGLILKFIRIHKVMR